MGRRVELLLAAVVKKGAKKPINPVVKPFSHRVFYWRKRVRYGREKRGTEK
jgi:hypothetical protein